MNKQEDVSSRPRVLVLLATYQGVQWIADQVESLLAQSGVDLHIVASDDASSDGTREVLAAMVRSDRRLSLLPDAEATGSAAANYRKLITLTDADGFTHVALCDQDDLWQPTKLSTACRKLVESDAELYSSAVLAWWPDGRTDTLRQSPKQRPADFLFEGAGQGCTFVMAKRLFDDVRAFLVEHPAASAIPHYHDWLIYALARSFGRRWVYDLTPSMKYRQHTSNDTGAQSSAGGIARRLKLIGSGWYREQVAAVAAVCHIANPASPVAAQVASFMTAASRARVHRIRWSVFVLANSRRRFRDRLILFAAALCGRL